MVNRILKKEKNKMNGKPKSFKAESTIWNKSSPLVVPGIDLKARDSSRILNFAVISHINIAIGAVWNRSVLSSIANEYNRNSDESDYR